MAEAALLAKHNWPRVPDLVSWGPSGTAWHPGGTANWACPWPWLASNSSAVCMYGACKGFSWACIGAACGWLPDAGSPWLAKTCPLPGAASSPLQPWQVSRSDWQAATKQVHPPTGELSLSRGQIKKAPRLCLKSGQAFLCWVRKWAGNF